MRSRGRRSATCVMVLLLLTGAVGCAGAGTAESSSSSAASAGAETAAADAEAVEVVQAFWDERIRVETSGAYGSADYTDLVDGPKLEALDAQYRTLKQAGFHRTGEPTLRDFEATVDGDTALVTVCVNEDDWGAEADIEVEDVPDQGFYADAYALERRGDGWLIVGEPDAPEGTTC